MTKSKSGMVTKDILQLTKDIFLDVVVKKNFPLISVDWYLFRVASGNRYLPRGSNENTFYITSIGNVFVARWVLPLVTIPLLDFVMIHWICWMQWNSFRKNSNRFRSWKHLPIFVVRESLHNLHYPFSNPSCKCKKIIFHHNRGLDAIIQLSGYKYIWVFRTGKRWTHGSDFSFSLYVCVYVCEISSGIIPDLFQWLFSQHQHHRGFHFAISSISNCLSKMSMVRTPSCFLSIN